MLKKQKAFEEETVKRLTPFYNSMKHPLVKSFIHRIILDTMKHSDMYQTLIDINERVLITALRNGEKGVLIKGKDIRVMLGDMDILEDKTLQLSDNKQLLKLLKIKS